MQTLSNKQCYEVSGGDIESDNNIRQGAEIGAYVGLGVGAIAGAFGFGFAACQHVPFIGGRLVSAGQHSYLGRAGMAATGAILGAYAGAFLGGTAACAYNSLRN